VCVCVWCVRVCHMYAEIHLPNSLGYGHVSLSRVFLISYSYRDQLPVVRTISSLEVSIVCF
jgi:hypothetical protein